MVVDIPGTMWRQCGVVVKRADSEAVTEIPFFFFFTVPKYTFSMLQVCELSQYTFSTELYSQGQELKEKI